MLAWRGKSPIRVLLQRQKPAVREHSFEHLQGRLHNSMNERDPVLVSQGIEPGEEAGHSYLTRSVWMPV